MKTSNNSQRDIETFVFGEDGFVANVQFSTTQLVLVGAAVFVAMYAALVLAKLTKLGE